MNYYKNHGQLNYANFVYYQYRYANLVRECSDIVNGKANAFNLRFLLDLLYWFICGFGVKP